MQLKYFLERLKKYSGKIFREGFGNYKFLVPNKFQRNFSVSSRTAFSSAYGPMTNPSALPKCPPKIANVGKSEVLQLPDESYTRCTEATQYNSTSEIVTNIVSLVILLIRLTETVTNIGNVCQPSRKEMLEKVPMQLTSLSMRICPVKRIRQKQGWCILEDNMNTNN